MRTRMASQRSVLEAAASALEKVGSHDENCTVVLASIRAELEVCSQRFPGPSPQVTPSESMDDSDCDNSVDSNESCEKESVEESGTESETNGPIVA